MSDVYIEQDGDRFIVSAKGHASTKELCAAISTLMFTIDGFIHNADAQVIKERMEPGNSYLEWIGDKGSETVIDAMALGFLQLEMAYKDDLRVEIIGVLIERQLDEINAQIKNAGF